MSTNVAEISIWRNAQTAWRQLIILILYNKGKLRSRILIHSYLHFTTGIDDQAFKPVVLGFCPLCEQALLAQKGTILEWAVKNDI